MSCLGFKGGIGTSSRVTPNGYVVAVLLMTNFGQRDRLTVAGVPVGRLVGPAPEPAAPPGRLVHRRRGHRRSGRRRRGALALPGGSDSASRAPDRPPTTGAARSSWPPARPPGADRDGTARARGARCRPGQLDPLFEAIVDATEEAVLNSLLGAPTVVGRDGNTSEGLDPDGRRQRLLEEHRARH